MTISFGGHQFTEPMSLSTWQAPWLSGIYAILRFDLSASPSPYTALYFGETDNFATRGIGKSHDKYDCWALEAGAEADLYISIFAMPSSHAIQRRAIEQQLIAIYRTPCND
jgi:hypothetical protein